MRWAYVPFAVLVVVLLVVGIRHLGAIINLRVMAATDAVTKRLAGVAEREALLDRQLEAVSGLPLSEARARVMERAMQQARRDRDLILARATEEAVHLAEAKAEVILAGALGRVTNRLGPSLTVDTVRLPSHEMKARVIGRGGVNVAVLQDITGVDITVDDHRNVATLTSFDPYRRFIAKRTLESLVDTGTIWPSVIRETYDAVVADADHELTEVGREAATTALVEGLSEGLLRRLGLLSVRTAHGRPLLQLGLLRSEVADSLAREFTADSGIARRAALLCDIGFTEPLPGGESAAAVAAQLAAREGESAVVCSAIARHSRWTRVRTGRDPNLVPLVVAAADRLVSLTGGDRQLLVERQSTRLRHIEDYCVSRPGVLKAYAMKTGAELRVFVEADLLSDLDVTPLAVSIAEGLRDDFGYTGTIIEVVRKTSARAGIIDGTLYVE